MSLDIRTYRGADVFGVEPNWVDPVPERMRRRYELLQFLGAGVRHSDQVEAHSHLRMSYLFDGRQEIHEMLEFFDDKEGRLRAFWCPTWRADLVVTAPFDASAQQIQTQMPFSYEGTWFQNEVTGRHVAIVFPDGDQRYRKTIGVPGPSTLALDAPIGKACTASMLPELLVSFLYYVRFDQDEIELTYHSTATAECELALKTVADEALLLTTTTTTTTTTIPSTTTTEAPVTTTTGVPETTTTTGWPITTTTSQGELWTPAELTTRLWLDGADSNTISLDQNNRVSQWNDKSENNSHAAQTSEGNRPYYDDAGINGKGCLDWGSGSNANVMTGSGTFNFRDLYIVTVWDGGGTSFADLYNGLFTGSSDIGLIGNGSLWWPGWFAGLYLNGAEAPKSGSNWVAFDYIKSVGIWQAYRTSDHSISGYVIGRDRNISGRNWRGRIAEIVAFSTQLSEANRQKVEGYLAWRWGLVSALPSEHPYKEAPPYK